MQSVRFTAVVKAAGRPEVHLVLTDPPLDPVLQRALKQRRVMTIHQTTPGTRADYGTVGFEKGVSGQVLIFPKSLLDYAGRTVVGIKYDLLGQPPATDSPGRSSRISKSSKSPGPRFRRFVRRPGRPPSRTTAPVPTPRAGKVVEFPMGPAEDEAVSSGSRFPDLKRQLRRALEALEDGKQVLAYQILRRVVGEL